ncbi:hypothetical protein AVEN_3198-1 [Araneus ventricosus]|uniref:Uncharacterized protein n=1 Tax=Araneus ventricosus TaxID=182803 RepID=A0A4Y2JJF3_ARAVE|nr:hypothetical protein AVEN_3198-1 [Araneus ventricosus]
MFGCAYHFIAFATACVIALLLALLFSSCVACDGNNTVFDGTLPSCAILAVGPACLQAGLLLACCLCHIPLSPCAFSGCGMIYGAGRFCRC